MTSLALYLVMDGKELILGLKPSRNETIILRYVRCLCKMGTKSAKLLYRIYFPSLLTENLIPRPKCPSNRKIFYLFWTGIVLGLHSICKCSLNVSQKALASRTLPLKYVPCSNEMEEERKKPMRVMKLIVLLVW